jgi:hypothetical protein
LLRAPAAVTKPDLLAKHPGIATVREIKVGKIGA